MNPSPHPHRAGWLAAAIVVGMLPIATLAASRQASTDTPLPDIQKLGPQIGTRVPSFTLQDQHGQSRTLESLLGAKGAMLVFFRSADW
jgi:cytochrome oxidase Cu insertion factor (SCO1/SenC/PrrC family)